MELKDRIFAKIIGWKAKLLSQADRTTLVKSVAYAIPTYVISLFLIPKTLCSTINSGLRKFWWGFPQDKKHSLSLLSWDSICKPKSLGGLGLKHLLWKVAWDILPFRANIGRFLVSIDPNAWVCLFAKVLLKPFHIFSWSVA
jgi:hypothetical protein